ncbi:MAG: hypothetical protein ACYTGL_10935 [Planctomycetota bacterium]|jgi:hypothetical protein
MKRYLTAITCSLAALLTSTSAFGQTFPSLDGLSGSSGYAAHAGLLGRAYVQARYAHLEVSDPEISAIDDSLQGFDVTFNAPIPWMAELIPSIGSDIFFNYEDAELSGPFLGGNIEVHGRSYQTGTSLYTNPFGSVRPFVQLGVEYNDYKLTATNGSASFSHRDDDTDLLLNVGVEADLHEQVSCRLTIDVDTDEFDDSEFLPDLIVWPHENLFLRAGAIIPFDGDDFGALAGGGIAF